MESAKRLQTIPLYRYTMFKDKACSHKLKPSSFNKIISPYWFFPTPQTPPPLSTFTLQDINNILQTFTHDQLFTTLQNAAVSNPEILQDAAATTCTRTLFLTVLARNTTTQDLHDFFSAYGEVESAKVIVDPRTNQSKGYGFVSFKSTESFLSALKQPSKRLHGNVLLAKACNPNSPKREFEGKVNRTVYIGNVPEEMESEKLIDFFSVYGEIEVGPGGRYDYKKGAKRNYCFVTYKSVEGAKNALMESTKNVDGWWLSCKEFKGKKKDKSDDKMEFQQFSAPPYKAAAPPLATYFSPYYYYLYGLGDSRGY
ncbi:hypothetical protein BUALT_Bualt18G0044100 [Buddleja alternifolia]|uniref:RRM domain-containing protein n=1 Tax=Buddleja alternifolia TaxID=168488 RepID=A0AAV6WBW7_9LAMI|nr:hypothetical protein BUALT_Bualt18G0044100 [Buddleja alternifolia]